MKHKAHILRDEGSRFSRHLGIRYVSVEDGVCVTEVDMAEHLQNVVGGFHGGAAFALVDCAMGAAIYSLLDVGINIGGEPFGLFCCENTTDVLEWTPQHIEYLRQVGTLLGFALKKARS